MGKKPIWERVKQGLASLGFKLFIWGNDTTEEEYWSQIYEQEKYFLESNQCSKCGLKYPLHVEGCEGAKTTVLW